jgi:hypothetical protein
MAFVAAKFYERERHRVRVTLEVQGLVRPI